MRNISKTSRRRYFAFNLWYDGREWLTAWKLLKKLETVNANLKKYGHVNKKAFEQYNNFTKQREQLRKRGEELDVSQRSIQDLIATLDQRKDEAIERTFKQVSKYFEEVFENLVPAGRGRLIMQKSVDPEVSVVRFCARWQIHR